MNRHIPAVFLLVFAFSVCFVHAEEFLHSDFDCCIIYGTEKTMNTRAPIYNVRHLPEKYRWKFEIYPNSSVALMFQNGREKFFERLLTLSNDANDVKVAIRMNADFYKDGKIFATCYFDRNNYDAALKVLMQTVFSSSDLWSPQVGNDR